MKQTSLAGWNHAQQTIGDRQAVVYDELLNHGPSTGRELDARLGVDAHKRLSELERLGLIKELTKRHCTITGRMAIVWAANNSQGKLF